MTSLVLNMSAVSSTFWQSIFDIAEMLKWEKALVQVKKYSKIAEILMLNVSEPLGVLVGQWLRKQLTC